MGCGSSKGDSDAPDIDAINVPDTESGYPPPKPPTPSRAHVFKPEKLTHIDDKARQVPDTVLGSYETLAAQLSQGCRTELERLRATYSWLGAQRIKERTYKGVVDPHTPLGYMKLIKLEKGTYSAFFALLCRSMKIPCVILRGESKALTYEPGDTAITECQWTAVYVDKQWRLVHSFWAFTGVVGYSNDRWIKVEEDGKAMRQQQQKSGGNHVVNVDDFWFLTDPDVFVYFCRATEKPWQLLPKPWTLEDFVSAPYFRTPYFSSGLKLSSEHKCVLKTSTGTTEVSFSHAEGEDALLGYQLLFDEKMSQDRLPRTLQLDRYVLLNSRPKEKSLYSRLPVKGIYKQVVNGGIGVRGPLAEFRLECLRVGVTTNPFPLKPEGGYGFGEHSRQAGLANPSQSSGILVVKPNDVKELTIKRTRDVTIQTKLHHYNIPSSQLDKYVTQEVKGENVRVKVQIPDLDPHPEYALQVTTTEANGRQSHSGYVLLLTHEELDEDDKKKKKNVGETPKKSPRPDEDEQRIRGRMVRATARQSEEELRAAILDFERAKLRERNGDLRRAKDRLTELEKARTARGSQEERLRRAMEGEETAELQEALVEFQESGLKDDQLVRQARERLHQLYLQELERAADERDLDKLEDVIERAEKSPVFLSLYNTESYRRALTVRAELRRLKKYANLVLALNKATVAEVHSYRRPKIAIHDVMRATGLLLGEKDWELRSWEYVQNIMRKTGKQSILRRIKEFDTINIREHTVNRSRQLLSLHDGPEVCQTSRGAGTFYKWSNNIINEELGKEEKKR